MTELEYSLKPRIAISAGVDAVPDLEAHFEDGPWMAAGDIGALVDRGRPELDADLATEVRVCHTNNAFYVAFKCADDQKVRTSSVRRARRGGGDGPFDWIEILVDPEHRHMNAWRFKLDANGHMEAWRIAARRSELPGAVEIKSHELDYGAGVRTSVRITEHGWEGAVELPYAKLGLDGVDLKAGALVVGLDIERIAPSHQRHWRWARGMASTNNTPLEYGDLYVGAAGRVVSAVDLGHVLWEGSPLAVTVDPLVGTADCELELSTSVYMPYDRESFGGRTVSAPARKGEAAVLSTSYELSHRGRWPVEAEFTQRLEIELKDATTGRCVYAGAYPFAVGSYLKPNEAFGTEHAPDPARDDGEFIKNKRRYIVSRIPRFIRRRVTDGAPSDFTLTAVDGSYEFDLMQSGALQRMADMICEIFETEEDRLVGAMMLIHQRTVTRHAGAYGRIFPASPLSILRIGGGICGVRSPALCGLVSLMKSPRTGESYFTRVIEIGGHTVTGITDTETQPPGECVVLDADCGLCFYPGDNSHLCTLAELERDWSIPYRSNVNNFRYDHEMFSDPKFHSTHGWPYHGAWPEGAPEW